MKRFAILAVLFGAMISSAGCFGTPGYTPSERDRMIGRAWSYEGGMLVDDFDSALLLRPPTRMTIWNVR